MDIPEPQPVPELRICNNMTRCAELRGHGSRPRIWIWVRCKLWRRCKKSAEMSKIIMLLKNASHLMKVIEEALKDRIGEFEAW